MDRTQFLQGIVADNTPLNQKHGRHYFFASHMEIQLSSEEDCDPINKLYPNIIVYLSQKRTQIISASAIVSQPKVSIKAINVLFLYFYCCFFTFICVLSVNLNSLSCSFTAIFFLIIIKQHDRKSLVKHKHRPLSIKFERFFVIATPFPVALQESTGRPRVTVQNNPSGPHSDP